MMEDVNDDFDDDEDDEQTEKKNTNDNGTNFNRALQKATGHMENTFVAAFAGVILAAILLRDQTTYAQQIRDLMPQKKFDTMAFILKKFFVFMHMSVRRKNQTNFLIFEIISFLFFYFSMRLHHLV